MTPPFEDEFEDKFRVQVEFQVGRMSQPCTVTLYLYSLVEEPGFEPVTTEVSLIYGTLLFSIAKIRVYNF
jgi:hypothetical protein